MNELLQALVLVQGLQSPEAGITYRNLFMMCAPSINNIHESLRSQFGEVPVVLFSTNDEDNKMTLYYSKKTKSVTLVQVSRDGTGCIAAAGKVEYLNEKELLDDDGRESSR